VTFIDPGNVFSSWCEPQWNSVAQVIVCLFSLLDCQGLIVTPSADYFYFSNPSRSRSVAFLPFGPTMHHRLPFSLVTLVSFSIFQIAALPTFPSDIFGLRSSLSSLLPWTRETHSSVVEKRQSSTNFETGSNGSQFLWLIQDTYEGQSFFE
jgi:hypothetical protein